MKNLVVVTTRKDISLPLFFTPEIQANWNVVIFFIEDAVGRVKAPRWGRATIYIRDPFTAGLDPSWIRVFLESLFKENPEADYIDNLAQAEDVFGEDKWSQYLVYGNLMPTTQLLSDSDLVSEEKYIFKLRLSSRAKGVIFEKPNTNQDSYIVQPRLDVLREYRVVELNKEILPNVLIKTPKSETGKVRVTDAEQITNQVLKFAKRISDRHNFDLVGYDIVETSTRLCLLENNRSPQIQAYQRLAGVNLFESLLSSRL